MEQDIHNAIDASNVVEDIAKELSRLPYNRDLSRLFDNLSISVSELSKLEVYIRRTHKRSRYAIEHTKKLDAFKQGVKMLRNYMLLARLMA